MKYILLHTRTGTENPLDPKNYYITFNLYIVINNKVARYVQIQNIICHWLLVYFFFFDLITRESPFSETNFIRSDLRITDRRTNAVGIICTLQKGMRILYTKYKLIIGIALCTTTKVTSSIFILGKKILKQYYFWFLSETVNIAFI